MTQRPRLIALTPGPSGHSFNDFFTLLLGYRYLSLDVQEEYFLADLDIQGYAPGFQFNW